MKEILDLRRVRKRKPNKKTNISNSWGVQVVKVYDFKQLISYRCEFESQQRLWVLLCKEAIQLPYGTSVVFQVPVVHEIMHAKASVVSLL
jgi:hypothetical protein